MSNITNHIEVEDTGHTPQYIGEYFLQQLRREIISRNYGNHIEQHFFKMLCFYYFDIDKKSSLATLLAYEENDLRSAATIWKNDIIVLLGQHLYDIRKAKGLGKIELNEFITGFVEMIVNTVTQTKQFAKICYDMATKMRKKWETTHNTLITKNALHTVIGVNSFSTLQNYIGTKKLGPIGHTNPYIYTPYSFGKAHIHAIDTLSYFLGLDKHMSIATITEEADTLKKLLSQENERKVLKRPQHSHIDMTFDSINTKKDVATFSITYTNQEKESSELYALLDTCFSYLPEDSVMIHYDKNHYIYNALQYIQNITLKTKEKQKDNIIDTDVFLANIGKEYGEYVYSFFNKVLDKNICEIQQEKNGYIFLSNGRSVHVSMHPHTILVEYQVGEHIIGEQYITNFNDHIIISPYNLPGDSTKIKKRCDIFGISQYIEATTGKKIDEYIIDINDIVKSRQGYTPKLDNTIAYMKYLLQHTLTINSTISDTYKIIDYTPSVVSETLGNDIKREIFMNYAETLSKEFNKRYVSRVKKDGVTPVSKTSLQFLEDIRSQRQVEDFSPEVIYIKLRNDKDNSYQFLSNFVTFIQQEERITKSIDSFEGLKSMTTLSLVKHSVLSKILTGIKGSTKKTFVNMKTIYAILEEYNIVSYLHNGSKSKVKDTILNHIHEYSKNGIYQSRLKLQIAEKKIEDENNRILEGKLRNIEENKQQSKTLSIRINEVLSSNIQKKYIHQYGLLYANTKQAIKNQDTSHYETLYTAYKALQQAIIDDCGLCGFTKDSVETIAILQKFEKFPEFEVIDENNGFRSRYPVCYYQIKSALFAGHIALQQNDQAGYKDAYTSFEEACDVYEKWYYDRHKLGVNDNVEVESTPKKSKKGKAHGRDKIRKKKYIASQLESYRRDFPHIRKEILLPIEANFITTIRTIQNIGVQAIKSMKKNTGEIDEKIADSFYTHIDQLSDSLYAYEGISKDSKVSEHKDKIKIMRDIDHYVNLLNNLLPHAKKDHKKVHISSKYKAEMKIICYKALELLCNNNIVEYEKLHQEYIGYLQLLEDTLLYEDTSRYQSSGTKNTRAILRKDTMDHYRSFFPTKEKVGLQRSSIIDDGQLHDEIIQYEYSKLPIYTKNALNKKVVIADNRELSSNRNKDFLDCFYNNYDGFSALPNITDNYAERLIRNNETGAGSGGKDMMTGYVKKHCMYIIDRLCQEQAIEDFTTHHIIITNPVTKACFIVRWKEFIKHYLLTQKEEAIRTVGTYENYIFHSFLENSLSSTGVISGKIAITVPLLHPLDERETDIDTINNE